MAAIGPNPAARAPGRRLGQLLDRPEWLGPLMIGPAVLFIFLVVGIPFLLALYYSVSDISMNKAPTAASPISSVRGSLAFRRAE